jgi:putative peptidoglycan lipid II flippase
LSADPPPPAAPAADAAAAAPAREKLNTRAAGVVAIAVLCSRVLGLAREQIQAALFGGGRLMDAFTIAFRTPNLLRDLFAEGALSTAFVTTFSKVGAVEGEQAAFRLANKIATLALVALSLITVLGIVFTPAIIEVLAPGFGAGKAQLTVSLARIMFPFILLVSLAALVMGMLNARGSFGIPATASSFFNLGSIIAGVLIGWWLDPHFGANAVFGLAIGTLVGGALQLAVQLPALGRLGYRFRLDFHWRDPGVSAILRLMGPSVVAASSTQVNVLINSVFASKLGDGPTFWLAIAFRLMQLPLGVFGVALGTVALPLLARMAALGDRAGFRAELAHGLRLAFLLTVPASVGLIVLADPIISVLYQHGRFTAHEASEAAGALRCYAIGLAAYAALKVLVNAFYALERRKTPMLVSFAAVGLNLLLNWLFTWHLGWGHRGLAFSTSCIAISNFLALYVLMHRQLQRFETRAMAALFARLGVASALLALCCWAGDRLLLANWASEPFWPKLSALLVTIGVAAVVFFGSAALLGVSELKALAHVVKRRLGRIRAA